jgi:hypothetical protein
MNFKHDLDEGLEQQALIQGHVYFTKAITSVRHKKANRKATSQYFADSPNHQERYQWKKHIIVSEACKSYANACYLNDTSFIYQVKFYLKRHFSLLETTGIITPVSKQVIETYLKYHWM